VSARASEAGVQRQMEYAEALNTLFSFCAQVVFYRDEYDALNRSGADYEEYEEAWERFSTSVDDIRDWLTAHGLERPR